jgi:hypothetical protein
MLAEIAMRRALQGEKPEILLEPALTRPYQKKELCQFGKASRGQARTLDVG